MARMIGFDLVLASCSSGNGITNSDSGSKQVVAVVGDSMTLFSAPEIRQALDPLYRVELSATEGTRIDQMLASTSRRIG
jgi:hypothetical protein